MPSRRFLFVLLPILLFAFDAEPRSRRGFFKVRSAPDAVLPSAQSSPSDSLLALDSDTSFSVVVTDIESHHILDRDRKASGAPRSHWLSFSVHNPEGLPFILRVSLENRGTLRNERHKEHYIPMRDLVIRYRIAGDAIAEKVLANTEHKGGGYVYEVRFLPEDAQAVYDMEFWSSLNDKDGGRLIAGMYQEYVRLEILRLME